MPRNPCPERQGLDGDRNGDVGRQKKNRTSDSGKTVCYHKQNIVGNIDLRLFFSTVFPCCFQLKPYNLPPTHKVSGFLTRELNEISTILDLFMSLH